MAEASMRAARPARKGGLSNAIFAVAAAEAPPAELLGRAHLLTITMPWGSLLRGALALDARAAAGIAALVAPQGSVEILLSLADRDRAALGLDAMTPLDRDELAERWHGHGLALAGLEPASGDDIAASGSTWARRLLGDGRGDGSTRPVWRLVLTQIEARQPADTRSSAELPSPECHRHH
jgi:hypothetical protein